MKVEVDYPCGYCGGPSNETQCNIGIGTGNKATSNCPAAYSFSISHAAKVSVSKPCTNVPMRCSLCPQTTIHWSYNMPKHMEATHPDWERQVTVEYHARIGVSQIEQDVFGFASVVAGAGINHLNRKRQASSPPGTPRSKAREEQQQHKSARTQEDITVNWNEDVFVD